MRPAILNPLFAEARVLTGVGPKIEKLIAKALGTETPRVLDLAFHLPSGLTDRRYRPKLIAAEPGRIATVTVNILDHKPAVGSRRLPTAGLWSRMFTVTVAIRPGSAAMSFGR